MLLQFKPLQQPKKKNHVAEEPITICFIRSKQPRESVSYNISVASLTRHLEGQGYHINLCVVQNMRIVPMDEQVLMLWPTIEKADHVVFLVPGRKDAVTARLIEKCNQNNMNGIIIKHPNQFSMDRLLHHVQ